MGRLGEVKPKVVAEAAAFTDPLEEIYYQTLVQGEEL